MRTHTKNLSKEKLALPGEPLQDHEMRICIKEAEKGPFYSIEESKKMIWEWRAKRNFK